MRSFDTKTAAYLVQRIHEIVPAIAGSYRTEARIEVLSDVPAVHCDEALTREMVETIGDIDRKDFRCSHFIFGQS